MSAALAWLPETPPPALLSRTAEDVSRRARAALDVESRARRARRRSIDLGTAVCISLSGGRARERMREPGVIIEIVLPGCVPTSPLLIIWERAMLASGRRFAVQTAECQVLRRAAGMRVVSP